MLYMRTRSLSHARMYLCQALQWCLCCALNTYEWITLSRSWVGTSYQQTLIELNFYLSLEGCWYITMILARYRMDFNRCSPTDNIGQFPEEVQKKLFDPTKKSKKNYSLLYSVEILKDSKWFRMRILFFSLDKFQMTPVRLKSKWLSSYESPMTSI